MPAQGADLAPSGTFGSSTGSDDLGGALRLSVDLGPQMKPTAFVGAIKIAILLTILSLAPAIFLTTTCFTRILVVFAFLRHAMGTQSMPPNQVVTGLAFFLSLFVMAPTYEAAYRDGIGPFLAEKMSLTDAAPRALAPLRAFMLKHTRDADLTLMIKASHAPRPERPENVPTTTLIPAFILSELRTSFEMGFLLFIPFLVLDMVTSTVLMSLGMMMLPPQLISLPFKVMLFVLVDGWNLVVASILRSYAV